MPAMMASPCVRLAFFMASLCPLLVVGTEQACPSDSVQELQPEGFGDEITSMAQIDVSVLQEHGLAAPQRRTSGAQQGALAAQKHGPSGVKKPGFATSKIQSRPMQVQIHSGTMAAYSASKAQQFPAPPTTPGPPQTFQEVIERIQAMQNYQELTVYAKSPRTPGDTDLYMFTPFVTNLVTLLMFLFAAMCGVAGMYHGSGGGNHCPMWVVGMITVSYICWAVGFSTTNTSYLLACQLNGQFQVLTVDFETFDVGVLNESPLEIVRSLLRVPTYESRFAGYAMLALAIGDPLLKLLLMGLGAGLRHNVSTVGIARKCIITVRIISKWASPLYFFLLTLHCQILSMHSPPDVYTRSVVDLGWAAYTIFCITNVISAVSIPLPPLPDWPQGDHAYGPIFTKVLLALVGAACAAYFFFLFAGLYSPLVSFKAPDYMEDRVSPAAHILLDTTVSLFKCISLLLDRVWVTWQLVPFMAILVIIVFAVVFPALDMLAMVFAVWNFSRGNESTGKSFLALCRTTRHIAATDVLIAGAHLASLGDFLELHAGVKLLLISEIMRYFSMFAVETIGQHIDEDTTESPTSLATLLGKGDNINMENNDIREQLRDTNKDLAAIAAKTPPQS